MDSASNIVGQIYDAAFDAQVWPELLCCIADFCRVENAALVVADPRIGYSSVVTPRADPGLVSDYAETWWAHDPCAKATAPMPVGRITSLDDTGRDAFFASPFYHDYWRHSGLGAERIATNLFTDNGGFGSVVLQASTRRDAIGIEARRRFAFLVPHLIRAVELARKLQQMEFERSLLNGGDGGPQPGTVIIDADRRVLFAHQAAEALIESHADIAMTDGRIGFRDATSNANLKVAVADCSATPPAAAAGEERDIRSGPGSDALAVTVRPFRATGTAPGGPRPVAMLQFEDPGNDFGEGADDRTALIQKRFGFTPAEARLALEMLEGDGRAAAARRCGISINTARTQLTSIFGKARVRRQAELIRELFGAGVVPGKPAARRAAHREQVGSRG